MRRLIIQIIQKRISLIKSNPQKYSPSSSQTPLPSIRKIDQTKIRIIVNGFDGIQSRVSLIKFHLDPNLTNLINTIQQMNKIQIPGIVYEYMDDKILLTVNCLTSKRGRKKRLEESRISDEASSNKVKEEYNGGENNNYDEMDNDGKRNVHVNVNDDQMDDGSQDDVQSIYDEEEEQKEENIKKNKNKNKSKKNNKKTSQINPNEVIKEQPIEYQHSAEQMSNCDIQNSQMSFLSN